MTCGTMGKDETETKMGLIEGHAYTLISAIESEIDGEPLRLLKIRNPWGRGEWKGDWSDNSEKWTDEMRKKVGKVDGNDGIFWMTLQDYVKNF